MNLDAPPIAGSALLDGARRERIATALRTVGVVEWISIGVLAVVIFLAILGPALIRIDPNAADLSNALAGPSAGHPLGYDSNGRDLLARLLHGARSAVIGPLLVTLAAGTMGTLIALTAAWRGGVYDTLVSRVVDAMFAFPGLLIAILATAVFGVGLHAAVIALAVAETPYIARVIRSNALRERSLPYVAALQVQGVSAFAICARHILPNLRGLVVATVTLTFGFSFISLASLSFLGLGVQPPTADWGSMVAAGVQSISKGYPQESLYAGLMIMLTVVAANLLGDRLASRDVERP